MKRQQTISAIILFLAVSIVSAARADDAEPESLRLPRPGGGDRLTLKEARDYMVSLINKDRAAENLPPVVLDQVASDAAQGHTNEMAVEGYHGHWGMDGKKPVERYTEGGGKDYVMENAWYYGFGRRGSNGSFKLDKEARFEKKALDNAESEFMGEQPPNDGHRQNILKPQHNRVGIAMSRANADEETYRFAMTEEFVDHYAEMDDMAFESPPGSTVHVGGAMDPGFSFYNVTLYQEPLPQPMTVEELNKTYSYAFPDRLEVYWPDRPNRPSPVNVTNAQQGQKFSAEIPLPQDLGKGMLYSVGVWANPIGQRAPFLVSLRTVEVRKR